MRRRFRQGFCKMEDPYWVQDATASRVAKTWKGRFAMGTIDICISHDTAFHWLVRNRNPRSHGLGTKARVLPGLSPSVLQGEALQAQLGIDDDKVEVLVGKAAGRRTSDYVRSHLCRRPLPAGSFVRIPLRGLGTVCCTSPELTFVQLSVTHPLLEAVYIGYALCSSYRVDACAEGGIAPRELDDEPLTSVARIEAFLSRVKGSYGVAKARRALAYVRDGSISPTESAMAMALSMPSSLGGFDAGDVLLGENAGGRGCFATLPAPRVLTVRSACANRDASSLNISLPDEGTVAWPVPRPKESRAQAASSQRRQAILVKPEQVLEFSAYVNLCEKVRSRLRQREGEQVSRGTRRAPSALLKRQQERQIELWRTLVCFSAFRQSETGSCVDVFDPPRVRDGR